VFIKIYFFIQLLNINILEIMVLIKVVYISTKTISLFLIIVLNNEYFISIQ